MHPEEKAWICTRCGHVVEKEGSGEVIVTKAKETRDILVVGDEETLPRTRIRCPKCGNNEAYWVLRQTRAADEPETRIYRCTKCGHTWREYA